MKLPRFHTLDLAVGFGRSLWGLLEGSLALYRSADCMTLAASASYFALLSFVPLIIMLLSALGFLLAAFDPGNTDHGAYLDTLLETAQNVFPFLKEDLKDRLRSLVEAREAVGAVGLIALVFTSSLVFGSLETALERVFEVPKPRHIVMSKLLFLGLVSGVGLLLVVSHYAITMIDSFAAATGGRSVLDFLGSNLIVRFVLAYVGTAIPFVILVRYCCNRPIRVIPLSAGATLFFFLWHLARLAFSLYIEYVAQFSVVYSSLSTLMILIFWVFYSANIFLYSAAFTRVLQRDGWRRK
jgi:membrane protein